MACKLTKATDIVCPFCLQLDQVHLGHGTVRNCQRCDISWGEQEDIWQVQKVVVSKLNPTEVPPEITERTEVYQAEIAQLYRTQQRIDNILALPPEAFVDDPPFKARDWQEAISEHTKVMKMLHLAARLTDDDQQIFRKKLLDIRRREYEQALTGYRKQVGCEGQALLENGPELSKLNEMSQVDATSIINTYNYDLGKAIETIKRDVPTANRHVYAFRLKAWEEERSTWKNPQIALFTQMSARQMAMKNFTENNRVAGGAVLVPSTAAEEICQGWLNRGLVPLKTALDNPSPYHVGCIHYWQPQFGDIGDCLDLWSGGSR